MNEKTVTISVSGSDITVTVTDAPNYPASSATVTVTPVGSATGAPKGPDGSPKQLAAGAQFDFPNLAPGNYLVSVDCGGKLFGRVVTVPAVPTSNAIVFFFTETSPPREPLPRAIGPLLPTEKQLEALGFPKSWPSKP